MPTPTILGCKSYQSSSFATTLDTSGDPIDFGTGTGRWCIVLATSDGNTITLSTVASGAHALTAGTNQYQPMGAAGNSRPFSLLSDDATTGVPTGTATLTLTASSGSARLQMIVMWGEGATAITPSAFTTVSSASPTWSISSSTNSEAILLCVSDSQTTAGGNNWTSPFPTYAASSGSTLSGFANALTNRHHSFALNEVGAATSTLGLTITGHQYTPATGAVGFDVVGGTATSTAKSRRSANSTGARMGSRGL